MSTRHRVYLSGDSRQTIASSQVQAGLAQVYLSGDSRQTIALQVTGAHYFKCISAAIPGKP